MNQYERIVSYIYQYQRNEKGANVGYVRLEKRGSQCRISVQMRPMPFRNLPKVYLYRQLESGIDTVYAGQMTARGGSMLYKASTNAEGVFGSEQTVDEMDGIFIEADGEAYYATSWKNDNFYLGDRGKQYAAPETQDIEEREEEEGQEEISTGRQAEGMEDAEKQEDVMPVTGHIEEAEEEEKAGQALPLQEVLTKGDEVPEETEVVNTENSTPKAETTESDMQMQSICGICPFKRKMYDYGKKILMTFPSMKPFQPGVAKACVRMELQDIGCLPIASWSLSGNRFLLHGYYCYRHLLFAQMEDGRYVLGVPGIYSDRERKNACRFGFSDFQSIGDFGMQQGAFGYWLLGLPEENQRFSSK